MTREVTSTTVKVARMEEQNGLPVAVELPDVTILGNVSMEKATKEVKKIHGENAAVFKLEANTQKYRMPVEEFIQLAEVVPENEPDEQDEDEDEE